MNLAPVACGDDGSDGGSGTGDASTSGTDGPTTGTTEDPPTAGTTEDPPTTGITEGEATGGTTDESTTGEPAAGCDALPLSPSLIEAGKWDEGLTIAGFAGADGLNPGVYDFARDADGALLAAGYFKYIGQEVVQPLVRRDAAWTGEPSLDVALERPTISAVAADGSGRVAIATYSALPFELAQREGEILLRDGDGFEVIATFKGAVRTMAWYEGELWVAGVFTLAGDVTASGLAVFGEMGWHEPPGGPLTGTGAYELTLDGASLLVGGSFSGVGGIAAQSVAAFDGADWTALDLPDSTVFALARDEQGELYAGGLFSVEGSVETGGVARWSGDAWTSLAGGLANPSFRGVVSDLVAFDGALHVAGCFTSAGGVPAQDLARWTGAAWEPWGEPGPGVGSVWFAPLKCGDEGPAAIWEAEHQRLFVDGERLYLGGFAPGIDNTASQSVIAWERGQWVAQGEAGRGLSGAPRSLAVGGPECAVHVMGGATHAGAQPVHGQVLRDEGDAWAPVGPPIPQGAYCWQLAVDAAGEPFLGCDLPPEGDEPPPGGVLRISGDAWAPLGEPFVQGGVAAVAFDPTNALWAAGGGAEGFVARAEGDSLVTFATTNGRVASLAFRPIAEGEPVQAVVGGYFTELEGMPAGGVARWTGAAWEPLGAGIVGSVLAVAYAEDGAIYASTADDGTPNRPILARWDGAAWTDVATPEPGPVEAGYAFYSLLARGKYVVAAGFGWPGSDERNVFVYDGDSFTSLRGGATAMYVESTALAKTGLWFGGTIAEAGPPAARISSVGVAHLE